MNRWLPLLCVAVFVHAALGQDSGAVRLKLALEDVVVVGRQAPPVVLPYATRDSVGPVTQPFDLTKELGRTVVLVFFPAVPGPAAVEAWRAIAAREGRWLDSGVVIAGVSADLPADQVRFAQQVALPFKLLSDKGSSVARRYGAAHTSAARYAVVVIGRDSRVRYVDTRFEPRTPASYVHLDAALRAARETP